MRLVALKFLFCHGGSPPKIRHEDEKESYLKKNVKQISSKISSIVL